MKEEKTYLAPTNARSVTCRFCGQTIYWGINENNKAVPLDPPGADGRSRNHWVTCPQRKQAARHFRGAKSRGAV